MFEMHQSSNRNLRWMDDDRPHSKDLFDLFGILITAVPLKTHRVRLQKKYHSLTTYEALHKLENLKFTHANKRPSPDDPRVQIITHLATTFSMVPEMARNLCQAFLAARLWESCEGKSDFLSGDAVWQLTSKGINLLQTFAIRNGVEARHVQEVLESPRNNLHLMILEREYESDKIIQDRATVEVIFRRFAGIYGPNFKSVTTGSSDTESVNDPPNGLLGVRLAREKRISGKNCQFVFSGKATLDWLLACCTFVTEKEAMQVAAMFVAYGFMEPVGEEKFSRPFAPAKTSLYAISKLGQQTARWTPQENDKSSTVNGEIAPVNGSGRDSNKGRLTVILSTPSLRMLFREFLRDTHCEENIVFYTEVSNFLNTWEKVYAEANGHPSHSKLNETLASSYEYYNSFLAPASPCELNIDHSLRFAVMRRMTKSELSDANLLASVEETVELFREAKASVFKLMASDSVPKFLRDSRYSDFLHEHQVDTSESSNGTKPNSVTSSNGTSSQYSLPVATAL